MSPRSNILCVRDALALWPRSTGVVLGALCAGGAIAACEEYGFSAFETLLAGVGYLLGLVGYKGMMLLMLYPLMYRAPFSGSFIGATFIVMAFSFAGAAIAPYVARAHGMDAPLLLIPFGAFAYVLFSLVSGAFLRASYWLHHDRRVPWRRLDESD